MNLINCINFCFVSVELLNVKNGCYSNFLLGNKFLIIIFSGFLIICSVIMQMHRRVNSIITVERIRISEADVLLIADSIGFVDCSVASGVNSAMIMPTILIDPNVESLYPTRFFVVYISPSFL